MPAPIRPELQFDSAYLFDVIIVGAGPAGLSAALALSRVRRTCVVFSTSVFRNDKAHRAHSVLSRDHQQASEIRRIGREQIDLYGTTHFVDRGVYQARAIEEGGTIFEVEDTSGELWRGRKIVLATGSRDVFPNIQGYAEGWGTDVWQCLFCDGIERCDRHAGLLEFPNAKHLHHVDTMLQLGCPRVTIFGNGPLVSPDRATERAIAIAKSKGVEVDERRIHKLVPLRDGEGGIEVHFEDDDVVSLGFLVHKPETTPVSPNLAHDLGVEIVPDGLGGTMLKRLDPMNETNVRGVFTAGDAGTSLKQFSIAMAQGNTVAAAISMQISSEDTEELAKRLGFS